MKKKKKITINDAIFTTKFLHSEINPNCKYKMNISSVK